MKGSENAEVEDGDGCRDCESMCMPPLQIAPICIQNTRLSLVKECHRWCPAGGCAWMNEPSERGGAQKTFALISTVWSTFIVQLIFISCVCLFKKKKGEMFEKLTSSKLSWLQMICISTHQLFTWNHEFSLWCREKKKITLLECPVLVQTSNYRHLNCLFPHTKFSRFLS